MKREAPDIKLASGAVATYFNTRYVAVPGISDEPINVYYYHVPCPVCGHKENAAFTYDAVFFANLQLTCRICGVFFRPITDPSEIPPIKAQAAVASQGEAYKPRFTLDEVIEHKKNRS